MPSPKPFVDPTTGDLDTNQILSEAVPLGKLVGLFVALGLVPGSSSRTSSLAGDSCPARTRRELDGSSRRLFGAAVGESSGGVGGGMGGWPPNEADASLTRVCGHVFDYSQFV